MNWYEWLKVQCGVPNGIGISEAVYFLDWDRARALSSDRRVANGDILTFILQEVGFAKERVLPAVDPAIRDLVSRMLDLPMVTLNSCSGHVLSDSTFDAMYHPYLHVLFKDQSFGERFIRSLSMLASNRGFEFQPKGGFVSSIDGIYRFGSDLPLRVCLQYRLPVYLRWDIR
jgi:hypothetical protein